MRKQLAAGLTLWVVVVALATCTALVGAAVAQPPCPGDVERTVFGAGDGQSGGACRQFTTEDDCAEAYHLDNDGRPASCFWDDADGCLGCGPSNEGDGDCTNTCRVNACEGNPQLQFSGAFAGQNGGSCRQFGDQTACEGSYTIGDDGSASCFWDGAECFGCGSSNEGSGNCVNSCRVNECLGAPSLSYVGPAFSGQQGGACRSVSDEAACAQSFHFGGSGFASCFWDAQEGACNGCGPNNERNGQCTNACRVCENDPGRTIFAGGPNTGACRQFDDDPTSCEQAYHQGGDGVASCFAAIDCLPCGDDNRERAVGGAVTSGIDPQPTAPFCVNSCQPPPTCADTDRTQFVGGPGTGACAVHDGDEDACEAAYHLGGDGVASCYYDSDDDECRGCGNNNEDDGDCTNTCRVNVCAGDTDRDFAGAFSGQNGGACPQFTDQTACEDAFVFGNDGFASCFWDENSSPQCRGCGENNEESGLCSNECRVNVCANDSTRTTFGGAFNGLSGGACPQFTDQTACEDAFVFGNDGFASCFWDENSSPQCRGCGGNNEENGLCTNTCLGIPECTNDSSRTTFAGRPGSEGCRQFDDDPEGCASAYVEGDGGVASCFSEPDGDCRGCGPENLNDGECQNTCVAPTCPSNPDLTFGPCEAFNEDAAGCAQAFQASQNGGVSCYAMPVCLGCGPNNQQDGRCTNSCEFGIQPTNTPTATPTSTPTHTPTLPVDLPDGSTCQSDTQCVSTMCEQGVCCATMCDGVARRCDLPGTVGTCVSVAAAAPTVTPWGLLATLAMLLCIGALSVRSRRSR